MNKSGGGRLPVRGVETRTYGPDTRRAAENCDSEVLHGESRGPVLCVLSLGIARRPGGGADPA
jgi:hypothetical protein